jgi:hypothetical protein
VGAANVDPLGHHFIERKFRVSNFQDVRGIFLFDCAWSIPSESILHKAEMRFLLRRVFVRHKLFSVA